jgi:hypothetical protein
MESSPNLQHLLISLQGSNFPTPYDSFLPRLAHSNANENYFSYAVVYESSGTNDLVEIGRTVSSFKDITSYN